MPNREERARQFLPFDALKGFEEALREKEIEAVEKIELAEEQIEEISNQLKLLEKGSEIEIIYYEKQQYFKMIGKVEKIDSRKKQLYVNEKKINFVDIFKIMLR